MRSQRRIILMNLIEIIKSIGHNEYKIISGNSAADITGITLSSKEAGKPDIFTAIKGFKTDGHKFINDAYERGCRNFFIDRGFKHDPGIEAESTIVSVEDTREEL